MFATSTVGFNKDIEVLPGASDGISDIAFSPVNEMIAAASWDNQVHKS